MELPRVVSSPCSAEEAFLLPRACRPFRLHNPALDDPTPVTTGVELASFLAVGNGPVFIVRPGVWPVSRSIALPPVAENTLLVGTMAAGPESRRWERLQSVSGGNLRALPWRKRIRGLPLPPMSLVGAALASQLASLLKAGLPLPRALSRLAFSAPHVSAAIHPALRCAVDPSLRILQAVTSLQRGGAERVCLEQSEWICRQPGARSIVVVLGRPGRAAWKSPDSLIDLSSTPADPAARADALLEAADAWGADVVHVHLLSAETSAALKTRGVPIVVTLHNQAVAWPTGTASLPADLQADLLLGCSRTVANEITHVLVSGTPPVRALPNGVQHQPLSPQAATAARRQARDAWRFKAGDVVVLAVANPRPQKRLEALPSIVAAAAASDPHGRRFRLVIAGSPGISSHRADESMASLRAAAAAAPPGSVLLLGDVPRTAPLMAAADVLVCCSQHEGLSLSWLEALREGLPVASSAVGSAAEVAMETEGVFHLAAPGDDQALARAILRALGSPRAALPPNFSARAMALRAVALCRRTVALKARASHRRRPSGVWIVTCNLALGGAQSSCRRLLETLHRRGVPARCAVVEEELCRPTFGRRALLAAGVTTHSIPPGRPMAQAQALLALMDADPPERVLFWNLPPVLRVLLADLMLGAARVIDVSPGEMSFQSLGRFFADPAARAGLPYPDARAYGQLLHAAVVKFRGEAGTATTTFGCPVAVIPNGVAVPNNACPRPLDARQGPLIFGTAARLSPDKRLEEAFDAFRLALPSLPAGSRFLVAGEADSTSRNYARTLRRACRGFPVVFLGRLDGADLHERFHCRLDAFVMISRPAGCPNASLEAMAAGLPLIATDWGGAREQVVHGVTGLLTPDGNPQALAEALVFISQKPAIRRSMAQAGRERARTLFSLDRMADDYLAL